MDHKTALRSASDHRPMKTFFLLVVLMVSSMAFSKEDSASTELFFQVGWGVHRENTVNPELKQAVPYASFSFLIKPTERGAFLEELNYVEDASKSGNLQIKYHTLEWNQWVHWRFGTDTTYKPYLALGVGLSQDEVKTSVEGSSSRIDKSRFYHNLGAGVGLNAQWWEKGAVVGEIRVWKYEQKKDPTVSGLMLLQYRL